MGKTFQADIPENRVVMQAYIPAASASDATKTWPVLRALADATIKVVRIIPQASITGQDTDSANWNLINKGTDGTGTTELGNIDFESGTDGTANVASNLLSAEASISSGEVLVVQREKVGSSGLALPEALVEIELELS